MRWLALFLLTLAGAAIAKNREVTVLDCSIKIEEGQDGWEADQYGVRWYRLTASGEYYSASTYLSSPAEREAMRRYGPFDPALETSVVFGPPAPRSKKPVWLALFAGQSKLPLVMLFKSEGTFSLASVSLFDLEPLLAAAPQLHSIYVLGDGTKLYQSSISSAEIRAAIERFPALARDYEARVAMPEGVCRDTRSDNELIVN
ncbi:MAG: hypothetical protein ACKOPE_13140 [Novosphingobium sp.]